MRSKAAKLPDEKGIEPQNQRIETLYADEDMGNNCGRVNALHGEFAVEMPEYGAESIALAYYIHYEDDGKEFLTECSTEVPNNENY